jgi:Kef-type K+ transport system membrane component KefB
LFANIGFALVMFVVDTHVPIRDPEMRSGVPRALARAVLVGAVAAALGVGIAAAFGTGHAALYAVLMASSSAALALPVIDSLRLRGPQALSVTVQIAIADAACIVLLPLVIDVRRAPTAALGGLAIAGCAVMLFVLLRAVDSRG